jgi:peptide-methionine (S)-S-oxide reductase
VIRAALTLAAASLVATAACTSPALAESAVATPAAKVVAHESGMKTAVFAGGCFWGIEGVFSHLKGVTSAVSGFHGGAAATAHYERVSDGDTGHAEAVKVTYDPAVIRYDQLLRVFFAVGADPTQLNRQGPDRGTQYRSALVPQSAEQNRVATAFLAQLRASGLWGKKPIVTRIERAQGVYPAEGYHQDFMAKNPNHGYIRMWDAPKIVALKRLFPAQYKASFTTG